MPFSGPGYTSHTGFRVRAAKAPGRWLSFMALICPLLAFGHAGSNSYLRMELADTQASGLWLIALRDLELAIGLDADDDGRITWGEVRARRDDIEAYAGAHLAGYANGESCALSRATGAAPAPLRELDDGVYWAIPFTFDCPPGTRLTSLRFDLMFDLDADHRGLLKVTRDGSTSADVFAPDRRNIALAPGAGGSAMRFLAEGVRHILEGYDHLLFLSALLIPIAFARVGNGASLLSRAALVPVLGTVLKVVTAFTIGHSMTLVGAVMWRWHLPEAPVEALIALSVAIAGVNIAVPLFRDGSWKVALGFGFVHGLGFASALNMLGLDGMGLGIALASFNVGVELGQLGVVALVMPVLLLLGASSGLERVVRPLTASLICALGVFWIIQRVPWLAVALNGL